MGRLGCYHYVYVLHSLRVPGAHYTGSTEDLQKRLYAHNRGAVSHTSKYKPWRIQTAIAFTDRSKALALERYRQEMFLGFRSDPEFPARRVWPTG
jgi:putative endonuclease